MKKISVYLAAGLAFFSLGGCLQLTTTSPVDTAATPAVESQISYTDLSAVDAYTLTTSNPDLVVLDVSPRFAKGHLPHAINYYIGDGSLDAAIPTLDKTKTYLVYCHTDAASIPGAEKLAAAGFSKVYRLKGNYSAWFWAGYPIEIGLSAVGNYSGSASATRSFFDKEFMHTVSADLADPAEGKFYEGWLVRGFASFSTGKLEKKDGKYVLEYKSPTDYRGHKKVVITEETEANGLDGKSEAHVLEGLFE